jgi:uncharacterized membrane protein
VGVTRDRATTLILAGILGGVGSLHFVLGDLVEPAVPRWVPARRTMVYASGALEILCGWALARRRPWAGPLSVAVLLAIWPANIQMAFDAGTGRHAGIFDSPVLMWLRVPLQLPMIWVAWRARRGRR